MKALRVALKNLKLEERACEEEARHASQRAGRDIARSVAWGVRMARREIGNAYREIRRETK